MPTRAEAVLEEATAKLRGEADRLRRLIAEKEEGFRREVKPLQAELDELNAAIARIEGRDHPTTSRRAPHGNNRRAVLDALAEGEHLTAAELSDRTGISKATLHAALARMKGEGLVDKRRTDRGVEHFLKRTSK